MVANLLASLDTARLDLINSHVDLEIEMNGQLDEDRFTQFIDPWTDAAYEMRIIAVDILEAKSLEEDYDWMAWLTETRRLKEDYARMVRSIEDQLVECKAAVVLTFHALARGKLTTYISNFY